MPEWLVEQGIGEDRAVLLDRGEVRAARLQRHGGLVPGLVADTRLISQQTGSRRGTLRFESGEEALVDGLPPDASEGTMLRALVTRSAIAEIGRHKRALARPTSAAPRPAPGLAESLRATGIAVRLVRRFPEDPWPERIAEAADGVIGFAGGTLLVSPTPAMTLIDVDGTLAPAPLAMAAVPAIAVTIGRLDLNGSIGIDFPSLERREDRRALDEALDRALAHWPHQRTAINGFGFVQLVSRLERPSLAAAVRHDRARAGALLLLRQAEDVTTPGDLLLTCHPRVAAAVEPTWREDLARRTGRAIRWHTDAGLALLSGFAQAVSP